ncbi:MAG: hypothetical protein JWR07_278, partial [Nevskia sp.]|nr:hypothetical protein [Nevskia sp.]
MLPFQALLVKIPYTVFPIHLNPKEPMSTLFDPIKVGALN